MRVQWKSAEDAALIRELARNTRQATQRDRYRVVLLAGTGDEKGRELFRDQIAARTGRSRQFVDEWVGRYRRGGLDSLRPIKNKGRSSKLTTEETARFIEMIEQPPTEENLAAYNGPILKRKIEEKFGKVYALSGVYKLLHRLGYNDLMPRPRHPQSDPEAQERFKKKSSPNNSNRSDRLIPISAS